MQKSGAIYVEEVTKLVTFLSHFTFMIAYSSTDYQSFIVFY